MAEHPSQRVAKMLWDCGLCVPGGNGLNESHLNGSKAFLSFRGEDLLDAVCPSLLVQVQADKPALLQPSLLKLTW